MNKSSLTHLIIASAIGTLGGAALVVLVHNLGDEGDKPSQAQAQAKATTQIRQIEYRPAGSDSLYDRDLPPSAIKKLNKAKEEQAQDNDDAEEDWERKIEEQTPEERRDNILDQKQTEIDAFDDESRDAAWADKAEDHFNEDFAAAIAKGDTSASLQSVECRSSRCVVTVSWPNLDDARKQHSRLAMGPMQENCITSSFLTQSAADSDGPIEHEIIYNCRPVNL